MNEESALIRENVSPRFFCVLRRSLAEESVIMKDLGVRSY